jgi:hypothetical protein
MWLSRFDISLYENYVADTYWLKPRLHSARRALSRGVCDVMIIGRYLEVREYVQQEICKSVCRFGRRVAKFRAARAPV